MILLLFATSVSARKELLGPAVVAPTLCPQPQPGSNHWHYL